MLYNIIIQQMKIEHKNQVKLHVWVRFGRTQKLNSSSFSHLMAKNN